MQTSGSTLDLVGNYCEYLKGHYSGNPIVSKEHGIQYCILITEKARTFANKISLTSVLQMLVCVDKYFSFILITYRDKCLLMANQDCRYGFFSFQFLFLDHFCLQLLSKVCTELKYNGLLAEQRCYHHQNLALSSCY